MSKKNKATAATLEAVPAMPVDATAVTTAEVAPKKKKCVLRAILALIVCIGAFFLPLVTFSSTWTKESAKLFYTVKAFDFATHEGNGLTVMIANYLPYVFAGLLVIAAIFSIIALFAGKKPLVAAAVFMFLGSALYFGGVLFISNDKLGKFALDYFALGVLAFSIILFIATVASKKEKKVVEEAPAVDPVAEMMKTFHTEEVIEAYAYEGGPVAGIEVAEEVFPTLAKIEAQKDPDGAARNTVASLLGNGFDAFLITLNEKEKNEFIDLYVLKCRGLMPEIPGYVVGGDNKDFFNKVFIYLGQYREKIPGDLLAKMYSFSMKI